MIRVLGPVDATIGFNSIPIGGPKQRMVLSLIAAGAGRVVTRDALVLNLYGESSRDASHRVVHTYVSNLRRVLGDSISSAHNGYFFRAGPYLLDSLEFDRLVRESVERGPQDPGAAFDGLSRALGLFRGDPYSGFEDVEALRPEIVRLVEHRVHAQVERARAGIACGQASGVIAELRSLRVEHPYREDIVEFLMTALRSVGMAAEAIHEYSRLRRVLATDIGVEPTPHLQAFAAEISL
ncbi:MAG: winged helix-turn-helix domain-containing protein [Acidimicrobiia bacterium]|nr:winged helix-turn-helix domain-containing protein [Acidimicrobiia bacterium]MDH4308203.1 winged helix-turn-helix domain-containing protein [Acidimicrobiia bacterium]